MNYQTKMSVLKNRGYHEVRSYKTRNGLSPHTNTYNSIKLGGTQGRSGQVRKISPLHRNSIPRTVQLIASR